MRHPDIRDDEVIPIMDKLIHCLLPVSNRLNSVTTRFQKFFQIFSIKRVILGNQYLKESHRHPSQQKPFLGVVSNE